RHILRHLDLRLRERGRCDQEANRQRDETAHGKSLGEKHTATVVGVARQIDHFESCPNQSARSGLLPRGISSRRIGDVAIVVTSAISTIIAKSVGEMILRSRPTLSTISSIKPRVFMSTPSP